MWVSTSWVAKIAEKKCASQKCGFQETVGLEKNVGLKTAHIKILGLKIFVGKCASQKM